MKYVSLIVILYSMCSIFLLHMLDYVIHCMEHACICELISIPKKKLKNIKLILGASGILQWLI
jgi:hypothetical protein